MGPKGIPDCAKTLVETQQIENCWKNSFTISEGKLVYRTHKLSKKKNKLSNKELRKKVSPLLVLLSLLALFCFVLLCFVPS